MPAATRKGDGSTGHGCNPPRNSTGSAAKTTINGILAHRKGDAWPGHNCPKAPPHPGSTSAGSANVVIEGSGVGRVGDSIACGDTCAAGSPNVFVN